MTDFGEFQDAKVPAARGFRVPYGVDAAGSLIPPGQATRTTPYICPACADKLTYRAGPIVSAHFAHRGGTGCTPESVLHAYTKLRVADAAGAWLSSRGPRPTVRRWCRCGWVRDDPIRNGVATVSLEHRLTAADCDMVADLALLDAGGAPRLLIEILVSHAVDAEKAAALRAAKVPWIELDAERVTPEAVIWEACAAGNVRPMDCPKCAAREQARIDAREQARIDAREQARFMQTVAVEAICISPTWAGYRTGVCTCHRCGLSALIFLWHGMFSKERPPSPRPQTIAWRYSTVSRCKHWVNTCGLCGGMLGPYIQSALDPSEYA